MTKLAEDYPWDLAEIMVKVFIQDRKDLQDLANAYHETALTPSAVAEEVQGSEEQVFCDHCQGKRSSDLDLNRSQCSEYPRSLAMRFFFFRLLEDRGIQHFEDRSDRLFQTTVLNTLKSTVARCLTWTDIH